MFSNRSSKPIAFVLALVALGWGAPCRAGWPPLLRSGLLFAEGEWPAGSTTRTGSPYGTAIADFNGDGRPDIAVCNIQGSGPFFLGTTVSVLLHSASSTYPVLYQPWVNYTVPAGPFDVAAADMNRDGRPDLVVNSILYPNDTLSVLLSTGASFRQGPKYSFSAGDGMTFVSDLNGDALPDVVTSDGSGVIVLLAVNADSLAPSVHYPALAPRAVADATGDGIKDIVAIGSSGFSILIFPGVGNGTFNTSPISISVPSGVQGVAVAFLNGDSFPDLITAPQGSNAVRAFYGAGGGAFPTQTNILLGGPSEQVAVDQVLVGDIDKDGDTDILAWAGGGFDDVFSGIFVLRNNGNGTFTSAETTEPVDNSEVLLADVDQDGWPDLVAPTYDNYNPNTHTVGVLLNDGTGGFRGAIATNNAAHVSLRDAVADFNGDGLPDVAISDSTRISILFGNGAGSFPSSGGGISVGSSSSWPSTLVPADVNLDGKMDLLAQVPDLSITPPGRQVNVYRGLGNGSFSVPTSFYNFILYPRSLVDMNQDGRQDVVGVNSTAITLQVYGNIDGVVFAPIGDGNGGNISVGFTSLCVGDWNRDGVPDVAVAGNSGLASYISTTDASGHWGGSFSSQNIVQDGRSYSDVCAADFNRDGIQDLAAREVNSGSDNLGRGIDVFLGTAAGGFGPPTSLGTVDLAGATIGTWDANRDGILDLIASGNSFGGSGPLATGIDVLLGDGEGRFGLRSSYTLGFLHRGLSSGLRPVTFGDVNLDGVPDILAGVYTRGIHTGDPLPVSLRVLLSTPPSPPVSGVEVAAVTPSARLAQNVPNPFNPSTTIRFRLTSAEDVRLAVYDVRGRLVAVLEDGHLEAGEHRVRWSGADRQGHPASSGVYYYRLTTSSEGSEAKRMMLLK